MFTESVTESIFGITPPGGMSLPDLTSIDLSRSVLSKGMLAGDPSRPSTRWFTNSPMLYNGAAAAAYLLATKPKSYSGYVGPDGTVRLMVELETSDEAAQPAPEAA